MWIVRPFWLVRGDVDFYEYVPPLFLQVSSLCLRAELIPDLYQSQKLFTCRLLHIHSGISKQTKKTNLYCCLGVWLLAAEHNSNQTEK